MVRVIIRGYGFLVKLENKVFLLKFFKCMIWKIEILSLLYKNDKNK